MTKELMIGERIHRLINAGDMNNLSRYGVSTDEVTDVCL